MSNFAAKPMDQYLAKQGSMTSTLGNCRKCVSDHNLRTDPFYVANIDYTCRAMGKANSSVYDNCVKKLAEYTFKTPVCRDSPACKATLGIAQSPIDVMFLVSQAGRREVILNFL